MIYRDTTIQNWSLNNEVVQYMAGRGYPIQSLVGIYDNGKSDSYVYAMDSFDESIVDGKPGRKQFRVVTYNHSIGGSMSAVEIDFNKGLFYSMDDSSEDTIKFETRGFRPRYARFLKTE